jgi:hypothetical protein
MITGMHAVITEVESIRALNSSPAIVTFTVHIINVGGDERTERGGIVGVGRMVGKVSASHHAVTAIVACQGALSGNLRKDNSEEKEGDEGLKLHGQMDRWEHHSLLYY